jgi:hypothetical protein
VAQKGLAPAPTCYVVWRASSRAGAVEASGYELPGEPDRRDEAAFEQWLVERDLAGADRLTVSVLVIREQLDEAGLVREGILERRRGGADGPYYGNVARVEFTGAAEVVRRYRAARDGRLTELPPDDATGVMPIRPRWTSRVSPARTPPCTSFSVRKRSFSIAATRLCLKTFWASA